MTKFFTGALVVIAFLGMTVAVGHGQGAGTGEMRRWGYQVFETTLVVDARPLVAEVLLDGRLLGSAQMLVAQAISVTPGFHSIEVRAPGYRGYLATFTADTHSSVNRFWIVLPPVRE